MHSVVRIYIVVFPSPPKGPEESINVSALEQPSVGVLFLRRICPYLLKCGQYHKHGNGKCDREAPDVVIKRVSEGVISDNGFGLFACEGKFIHIHPG